MKGRMKKGALSNRPSKRSEKKKSSRACEIRGLWYASGGALTLGEGQNLRLEKIRKQKKKAEKIRKHNEVKRRRE